MVSRVLLEAVTETDLQVVRISALADEVLDDVERVQNYGFTSHPLAGAEGVAVFVAGNRSHGIVLALDDRRYRLKLAPGEVALYDDKSQAIKLKSDGIEIDTPFAVTVTAGGDATINAGGVVNLGGTGGKKVARLGDPDTGGHTISGGSSKVFAVD
ncbi:MAG: phage baseplate assembly protein domain-containing protein [Planctomycetota bacterium]|jgi:phage baseplate assembly protein V